ncbi:hypothetical protein BGZ68_002467 [Mortierella alpina]|nr:hypothetical protein BGZ68_002467 [Mortierella alpina]
MPLTRSSCFYVSSLFFLVAVTAYDVIFQIFHPTNKGEPPNYKNLAVFGGSYVLLGLLATIFGFSRYVTVKLARQAIPKTYMPISREDLPKKVYEFVQSELDRVAKLAKKATPLLEDSGQPGWGKPGSSLHDTHFKTFMASTPHFIERAAVANAPDLARPPNMSISAYVHLLIDQKLITRDLGLEYIAGYEQARFGGAVDRPMLPVIMQPQHTSGRPLNLSTRHPMQDPSLSMAFSGTGLGEDEYIRFMKVLSLLLQELGWNQEAEEAYEEECRQRERLQQQPQRRIDDEETLEKERHQHDYYGSEDDAPNRGRERPPRHGDALPPSGTLSSRQGQGRQHSQLSGESYYVVQEAEIPPYATASIGYPETSGNTARIRRKLSRNGNLSTRSLLTMRTMRTASSTKSWDNKQI